MFIIIFDINIIVNLYLYNLFFILALIFKVFLINLLYFLIYFYWVNF